MLSRMLTACSLQMGFQIYSLLPMPFIGGKGSHIKAQDGERVVKRFSGGEGLTGRKLTTRPAKSQTEIPTFRSIGIELSMSQECQCLLFSS
jgi:hypothetical protein